MDCTTKRQTDASTQDKLDVYRATQAKQNREGLILDHLGLVRSILGKTVAELPDHIDFENLEAAGVLGLVEAALQFDELRGVPFKNFAYPRIRGAIVDELRRNTPLPQKMTKMITQICQATESLSPPVTPEKIADTTGLTLDEIESALDAMRLRNIHAWDEQQGWMASLSTSHRHNPENEIERKELLSQLADAIDELPENERVVITLYYLEDLRLKEIGEVLGLSESRISRLLSKAEFRLSQLLSHSQP